MEIRIAIFVTNKSHAGPILPPFEFQSSANFNIDLFSKKNKLAEMKWIYNDGGRQAAGYKGDTKDCVTRAIAIATGIPYSTIYDSINSGCKTERKRKRASASNGVHVTRKWFKDYLTKLGWEWVPTMNIGSGCKTHLRTNELPNGPLIVRVSKHFCAVIDGVLYDTFDCSRNGTRCVYGFWKRKK